MHQAVKDRVAVVTGATSGIGRATALALARAGARVVACGREQAELAELAPHVDLALTFDATDVADLDVVTAAVLDRLGGVDVLVLGEEPGASAIAEAFPGARVVVVRPAPGATPEAVADAVVRAVAMRLRR